MALPEELFSGKPNLRSKGSRFGIHTGNTLKWSLQDHLAARKPCGLIRKEEVHEGDGRHPKLIEDGLQYGVEYSINRKQRWELADKLKYAAEELEEYTERIYEKGRPRFPLRNWKYSYRAKSDEFLYSVTPTLKSDDHEVVAIVENKPDHPRWRQQNASRLASVLDRHRMQRSCRCTACRYRMREHKRTPWRRIAPSKSRTERWHAAPCNLRKHGPSKSMKKLLHIADLYEITEPFAEFGPRFPMHHEFHLPSAASKPRKTKLKDLYGLRRERHPNRCPFISDIFR